MPIQTRTPETDPNHHTIGHFFRGHDSFLYLCDSHVSNMGYWMTRTDDASERRNVSERAIGGTYHEPNETDLHRIKFLKALSDSLPGAVTHHEAGFHFEEGGCWAMAKALHDLFEVCRMKAVVLVRDGDGAYAMVRALDGAYDHRGMGRIPSDAVAVEASQLEAIAARHGIGDEQFWSDMDWAQSIVSSAVDSLDAELVPTAWCEQGKKQEPKP